ncbi:hypothetical protein EAS64_28415 [Trebonia kvetii]|uniref:Uncharacterized protein n=1 Tax=Trebonia kvetii TaxID=2480626 RepID=A0A6P2BWS4_9ACTN|nr:hypothetical protein EAS64_28415 [Trebonia kvetii]
MYHRCRDGCGVPGRQGELRVRPGGGRGGIGQFLDIGTGIPTAGNTHRVAQAVAPESRVVYVDYDHSKPGCAHVPGPDRPLRAHPATLFA